MLVCILLSCQSLLSFEVEGEGPLRFGFPLPAAKLVTGLHLGDARQARLQWSYLQQDPDPVSGRQWVELAIIGARGRVDIRAGGVGPSEPGTGDLLRYDESQHVEQGLRELTRTWRWQDGTVDRMVRSVFTRSWTSATAEQFAAGEALRVAGQGLILRCVRARIPAKAWRRAGVLPKGGHLAAKLRAQLLQAVEILPELPGDRGHGDYGRAGGVVTNLEFDTCLAFARLALASGRKMILQRALESAWHLLDRDLDQVTGLPYRHGRDHRWSPPEIGHVWLQGLLLVGCIFADRELIAAARSIGDSLGQRLSKHVVRTGFVDRMRDEAWPLWELESLLRFEQRPKLSRIADHLADRILSRWDPGNQVLRYGEGESRGEAYKERAWLTGGIMLPALRAYVGRTGDSRAERVIAALQKRLLQLVRSTAEGLPVQYWLRDGEVFGVYGLQAGPESVMLLEGLRARDLRTVLKRSTLRRALAHLLPGDDPNLATSFTMVGRCAWVYR